MAWPVLNSLLLLLLLGSAAADRRAASPTLMAGAMTGLGIRDYERVVRDRDPNSRCKDMSSRFRTFDGTCNNERNLGAADTRLARLLPAVYQDGVDAPRTRGADGRRSLEGARRISSLLLPDRRQRNNNTLLLMQWGQFLDHDMTLMPLPTERIVEEGGDPIICCGRSRVGLANPQPEECLPITFRADRDFRGSCMEFVRTIPAPKLNPRNGREPREQLNALTAFIDASSVYGSSEEEEEELREANGRGYLLKFERSNQGPLLPRTERGICVRENDDPEGPVCFIAGDERVNEQPALATIHTIFLRLHNLIARRMVAARRRNPPRNFNSTVFLSARRVVGAIVQNIMFDEWLPIILGGRAMRRAGLSVNGRSDYDPSVDPTIVNEFSTAAYRLGHSLVPRFLPTPSPTRNLRELRIRLRDHFLRPRVVRQRFIALATGLVTANRTTEREQSQAIDSFVSRELSEHLFEPNGRSGLGQDLMSINIQRGRDHALQPYNAYRELFDLGRIRSLNDTRLGRNGRSGLLARVYRSIDDVDLFVGGLSEPPNNGGGQLGETFTAIVAEQMRRLKFGDRFFFTHREQGNVGFNNRQLRQIRRVTAAMVMCLGLPSLREIQPDAFVEEGRGNMAVSCSSLRRRFINVRDFIVEA